MSAMARKKRSCKPDLNAVRVKITAPAVNANIKGNAAGAHSTNKYVRRLKYRRTNLCEEE